MRPQTVNQFKLEALEPRLLLSADPGLLLDPATSPSGDSFEVLEHGGVSEHEEGSLTGDFEVFPERLGEVFDPLHGIVEEAEEIDATEDARIDDSESDPSASQAKELRVSPSVNASSSDTERKPMELSRFDVIRSLKSKTDELVETLHAANGPPEGSYGGLTGYFFQFQGLDSTTAIKHGGSFVSFSSTSSLLNNHPSGCRYVSANTEGALRLGPDNVLVGAGRTHGDITNYGTLSPGNSPGVIDHTGDFTQAGVLVIEVGGLNPGPGSLTVDDGYDQLNVSRQLTLGGTLEISLINDFSPTLGDSFEILTFGSLTGDFSSSSGLNLGNGLYLKPVVGEFSYRLTVSEGVSVSVDEGQLTVNGGLTSDDDLTVSLAPSGSDLLIHSPNAETLAGEGVTSLLGDRNAVTVPLESLGTIAVNGFGGDDILTVDFSAGNPIPSGGLMFNGGEQRTEEGDQLVIQGGEFDTASYQFANAHDGSIVLDGNLITYTGLEPITDNNSSESRVFGLSNSDDADASLSSANGGNLTLAGSTFEEITFSKPTNSIVIQGLAGNDSITIGTIDLGSTSLTIEAETIELPSGATISGTGDVTLNAVSEDFETVTSSGDLVSRSARVAVLGDIDTAGSISLSAEVVRDVGVSVSSFTTLTLEASSIAQVEIGSGASLTGTSVSANASTRGNVNSENALGGAANKFTDSVSVVMDGAAVTAGALSLGALRTTQYSAKGTDAFNQISGDTKATVSNGTVNAAAGGASISAEDAAGLTAESAGLELNLGALGSNEIGFASARNWISGVTEARILGSTVSISANGSSDLRAERRLQVKSTAETISLTGSLPAGSSITLNGIYTSNTMLGNVEAMIEGGSVSTAGTGDIEVHAKESSAIDARSGITATGAAELSGSNSTIGPAIAFNAIGWDPGNFLYAALDALLGTSIGTETPVETTAYILDSTVTSGNNITVAAQADTKLNSTVSNVAESTASGLFGASGMAVGGVLASNLVSSKARAFVEFSASQGVVEAGGDLDVSASDDSGVYSNAKLVSSSTVTNDGGISILEDAVSMLTPADFETGDGVRTVNFGEKVRLSGDYSNGGIAGHVYQYMGTEASVDLSSEDYSDLDFWQEVLLTSVIPDGMDFSAGSSVAVGGMVVRNDVRSAVDGFIKNAEVRAGGLTVSAIEKATIHAIADSTATASGVSAFGSGTSLAVNGTIATNLVLSRALATVIGSTLTVDQRAVQVRSENGSVIDADTQAVINSEGTSVGVMLAFNTIGWEAQNVLFQAIDALLGTSIGDE